MKSLEDRFWEAPLDSLVDADMAAAGIKHKRRWLNKLVAAGEGPAPIRLSRKLLFRKRDVLRWLEAQAMSSESRKQQK